MTDDEDMLIRHGDFLTLMAVIMALLDRTGGQITVNLPEANGLFAQWRLGKPCVGWRERCCYPQK